MAGMEPDGRQEPDGGPWGDALDVILCLLPLAFLVATTLLKRIRLPTAQSLPMAAALMWLVRLGYLSSKPNEVNAAVIAGALEAITPLSIIAGAILLFSTMQHTMCLPWITQEIKNRTKGHRVAEVFLIGWAFAYLVEGASGFGTPAALGAPMLVELGHPPFQSVVCLLIMNTLATPFGAVGTPLWFGFGDLGLSSDSLLLTGLKVSAIDTVAAHVVPLLAASFLVSWEDMRKCKLFILLSIWSCVIPATALSVVSYEFSTIIGGASGVVITAILAQYSFGLVPVINSPSRNGDSSSRALGNSQRLRVAKATQKPATPCHVEESSSRESPLSSKPRIRRSASFDIGTLTIEPHIERASSFESSPGDFFHEEWNRRVKDHLHFPITYDPSNFSRHKVTRGVQAGPESLQTDRSIADMEVSPEGLVLGNSTSISKEDVALLSTCRAIRDVVDKPSMVALDIEAELPVKGETQKVRHWRSALEPIARTMPLWGTVLILVITRVPQFGVKKLLQKKDPHMKIDLGTIGDFRLSASLVASLSDIIEEGSIRWTYQALFVPAFLPFVVMSSISLFLFRRDLRRGVKWWRPFSETVVRVGKITTALVGALVLVSLIRTGGNASPAFIIGSVLSDSLKDGFVVLSPLLGALGSFFSGSSTVSNLTFGPVQSVAAQRMDRPVTSLLALQCVGATMGNMLCINNIISARAVLGLTHPEGDFIRKTAPAAGAFYIISMLVGLLFVF